MSTPDEEAARAADDAALAAAEALFERPTPGPWLLCYGSEVRDANKDSIMGSECCGCSSAQLNESADAAFIAASREGWPEAVAIARRALRENQELREKLERVREALAYDSEAHHGDAPCTDACMHNFRMRVRDAICAETDDEAALAHGK